MFASFSWQWLQRAQQRRLYKCKCNREILGAYESSSLVPLFKLLKTCIPLCLTTYIFINGHRILRIEVSASEVLSSLMQYSDRSETHHFSKPSLQPKAIQIICAFCSSRTEGEASDSSVAYQQAWGCVIINHIPA